MIVSNRLPLRRTDDGWEAASGGLVAAMLPIAVATPSAWVGWLGDRVADPDTETITGQAVEDHPIDGVRFVAVDLAADEVDAFYEGFSNASLWPLYHDALRPPQYDHVWWRTYRSVNRRFADVVARTAAPGATVWVHDYQLHLVPGFLRERRPDLRIGFFLHIPFPPVELFEQLPWRVPVLEGTLGADLVGFQTEAHADNFMRAVERLIGLRVIDDHVRFEGRTVDLRAFPISIDVTETRRLSSRPEVVERATAIRAAIGDDQVMLLGVDRLDYTKGIDRRFSALHELYESGRLDPAEVVMVQVAVPTREDAPGYSELRDEVERLAGRINGRFARIGRPAVHYLYRSVDTVELAALYRAADVMLVTPLRDGMNLVAKEYVAGHDGDGVLVLSEFAGAARELEDAVLVNPFDERALSGAIERAVSMPAPERHTRMEQLRRVIEHADVHAWAESFLGALRGDVWPDDDTWPEDTWPEDDPPG